MNAPRLFAATVGTVLCFPLLGPHASAAVSLTFASQTINFDSTFTGSNNGAFTGTGFAPTPAAGQLDSDAWRVTGLSDGAGSFGGTHTSGDFARGSSSGGVSTGGVYAFDVGGGDIALGVQPGGSDFTPGTFTLKLRNDAGSPLSSVAVAWDVYILNNAGRSNTFEFSWSLDDSTYNPTTASVTSNIAADPNPAWQKTPFALTLSGVGLAPGGELFLKWTGDDHPSNPGTGSRDEFALDNITFSAIPASSAIPEPGTTLVGLVLGACLFRRRRG